MATPARTPRRTINKAASNGAAAPAKKAAAPVEPTDKVTVVMTREKDTKNTVRYVNPKEGAAISALYINKAAAGSLGASITVTVN